MRFHMDREFLEYFRNLKQVFLYVTDECNLRCKQCLYKPSLLFHMGQKEIPLQTALNLLADFKEMGASKLTIMGGEPTLYGSSDKHKPLLSLIAKSKELGYEYTRVDSNGMFDSSLLLESDFRRLDEITFSLDGHTPELNDMLRGKGSFIKCLSNIRKAVELGYNVQVTCCIHRELLRSDASGNLIMDSMIGFVEDLGVRQINFHDLFKTGVPRDAWTGEFDPSLEQWTSASANINANIEKGKYRIQVRIPQCFTAKAEFERNPEYYGYCPAKMGERVLIHPDGIIRICSLMIGTPYGIARYYDNSIFWDKGLTNELRDHKLETPTPCTNQSKGMSFDNLVPLCVSFKPGQEEFIWKEKIHWESEKASAAKDPKQRTSTR